MISASSLLSILVIERVDEGAGLSCLISLLSLLLVSSACERVLDDMRLWVVLNFIPCVAIPAMLFLFPPKYTHSRFWFLATGFYLLARFEGLADRKVYSVNRYFISGHSLEHLCFAMVTLILTVMLSFRNIKIARDSWPPLYHCWSYYGAELLLQFLCSEEALRWLTYPARVWLAVSPSLTCSILVVAYTRAETLFDPSVCVVAFTCIWSLLTRKIEVKLEDEISSLKISAVTQPSLLFLIIVCILV